MTIKQYYMTTFCKDCHEQVEVLVEDCSNFEELEYKSDNTKCHECLQMTYFMEEE